MPFDYRAHDRPNMLTEAFGQPPTEVTRAGKLPLVAATLERKMMTSVTQATYEQEFARAWTNTSFPRFELPAIDVNRILSERYRTGDALTFTRTMLWDVEVRKARQPDRYIPSVAAAEGAVAWGQHTISSEVEEFLRASHQRLWLAPAERGLILERVCVDSESQAVTFIGVEELTAADGSRLLADKRQPLFNVQHSVEGAENQPLSRWRIAHLTNALDPPLADLFAAMERNPWLPEFVEIYIRDDLGIGLRRVEPS